MTLKLRKVLNKIMEDLSKNFYENNYELFSDTRFCLWDVVKKFSENFKYDSKILDAGCGNGKNIKYFNDKCNIIGIDNCNNLVRLCIDKGYNVVYSDIRKTNFDDNYFDYIISIAVIHHIDSEEGRVEAINELIRILKKNGKLLITLWAFESDEYSSKKKFNCGDNIVKFKDDYRYYYIYDKKMINDFCKKINYEYDLFWERGNWNIIITK